VREFSNSVLRAGELLEAIIHAPQLGGLKLADIAAGRPYSRTTTYRLLQSLIQLGLVAQTADFRYVCGPAMMEYALRVGRVENWLERARAVLERVHRRTGETAAMSLLLAGTERLLVDQAQYTAMPVGMTTLGARVPLDTGATGIAILSRLGPEELERYLHLRRQDHRGAPASDEPALLKRIDQARRHGYAATIGEYSPNGAATAVPVVIPQGTVVGALTIKIPADRFDPHHIAQHAAILKAGAAELTAILIDGNVDLSRAS
jgi:DNA-binding IclR family transcriptional regulator